jgi:serine/threonine protein kinase
MGVEVSTRLGPYMLGAAIGAGGMGEVYRAHDTRLNRDVAIKVLPTGVSSDAERLRPFEQEARILAALSEPDDCTTQIEAVGGKFCRLVPFGFILVFIYLAEQGTTSSTPVDSNDL